MCNYAVVKKKSTKIEKKKLTLVCVFTGVRTPCESVFMLWLSRCVCVIMLWSGVSECSYAVVVQVCTSVVMLWLFRCVLV